MSFRHKPLHERWAKKVRWTPTCWIWTGSVHHTGYGNIGLVTTPTVKTTTAHRVGYMIYRGPIPEGLQLDHLCRNRICVNPWHLEAVTARVNILRGTAPAALQFRQTHCKRGHPLSGKDLYVHGSSRVCLACQRWRHAQRKAA